MRRLATAGIYSCLLVLVAGPALNAQDEATEPGAAYQRVELPRVDLAIEVPVGWGTKTGMNPGTFYLLGDEYDGLPGLTEWGVLEVWSRGGLPGGRCRLEMLEDVPVTLSAHAEQLAKLGGVDAGSDDEPAVAAMLQLPIGEAAMNGYSSVVSDGGRVSYVFESADRRFAFSCRADSRDIDAWRRMAESIEPLREPPVQRHRVDGFKTLVPVVDPSLEGSLDGSLMNAGCWSTWWLEYGDGTFEERLVCELMNDPVDPPAWQASWPTEQVTLTGGACEWTSDFWAVTDGSDVHASSYEVTTTPSGRVLGFAAYPAEALDCPVE